MRPLNCLITFCASSVLVHIIFAKLSSSQALNNACSLSLVRYHKKSSSTSVAM